MSMMARSARLSIRLAIRRRLSTPLRSCLPAPKQKNVNKFANHFSPSYQCFLHTEDYSRRWRPPCAYRRTARATTVRLAGPDRAAAAMPPNWASLLSLRRQRPPPSGWRSPCAAPRFGPARLYRWITDASTRFTFAVHSPSTPSPVAATSQPQHHWAAVQRQLAACLPALADARVCSGLLRRRSVRRSVAAGRTGPADWRPSRCGVCEKEPVCS